jgi:hypothetical protein
VACQCVEVRAIGQFLRLLVGHEQTLLADAGDRVFEQHRALILKGEPAMLEVAECDLMRASSD